MKNLSVVFTIVLSATCFADVDVAKYEREEARLLSEEAKLEAELQSIREGRQRKMWSDGVEVTEAAIEAERNRRANARFKLSSFAGYKFGSYAFHEQLDAHGSREEDLMFPIRVFTKARLYYTPQHKKLWKVELTGYVDADTSREDCYVELAKVMDIIKDKYHVDLKQHIHLSEREFDSHFHAEIGRMDFDGRVGPEPGCRPMTADGRKRIRFMLAVSNFAPFDQEDVKTLSIDSRSGASKL